MNAQSNSQPTIVIVDYGTGNLNSIRRTLDRVGAWGLASSDAAAIRGARKIILPGVGHFGKAMAKLRELDLLDALKIAAIQRRIPVLGICLGMELMAKSSEEGRAVGLGWLDAEAVRFDSHNAGNYKVPHMGWNHVNVRKASRLMSGINADDEFYFAHSFHLRLGAASDLLGDTDYGITFPSAVEKDNIFGVQFHPEKSHDAGARILKNFVDM